MSAKKEDIEMKKYLRFLLAGLFIFAGYQNVLSAGMPYPKDMPPFNTFGALKNPITFTWCGVRTLRGHIKASDYRGSSVKNGPARGSIWFFEFRRDPESMHPFSILKSTTVFDPSRPDGQRTYQRSEYWIDVNSDGIIDFYFDGQEALHRQFPQGNCSILGVQTF